MISNVDMETPRDRMSCALFLQSAPRQLEVRDVMVTPVTRRTRTAVQHLVLKLRWVERMNRRTALVLQRVKSVVYSIAAVQTTTTT